MSNTEVFSGQSSSMNRAHTPQPPADLQSLAAEVMHQGHEINALKRATQGSSDIAELHREVHLQRHTIAALTTQLRVVAGAARLEAMQREVDQLRREIATLKGPTPAGPAAPNEIAQLRADVAQLHVQTTRTVETIAANVKVAFGNLDILRAMLTDKHETHWMMTTAVMCEVMPWMIDFNTETHAIIGQPAIVDPARLPPPPQTTTP